MTMANMGKASTAVRKPKIKRAGILLRLKRDLTQARGIVIATQSTAASAAGIQATFSCGGFFGLWFLAYAVRAKDVHQASQTELEGRGV